MRPSSSFGESTDRICSKRLKALMPTMVEALERHGHLVLGTEFRALLLGISAATMDRLLTPQRAGASGRRRRRRSNGLVRSQIPVRTFSCPWQDVDYPKGALADCVIVSGESRTRVHSGGEPIIALRELFMISIPLSGVFTRGYPY